MSRIKFKEIIENEMDVLVNEAISEEDLVLESSELWEEYVVEESALRPTNLGRIIASFFGAGIAGPVGAALVAGTTGPAGMLLLPAGFFLGGAAGALTGYTATAASAKVIGLFRELVGIPRISDVFKKLSKLVVKRDKIVKEMMKEGITEENLAKYQKRVESLNRDISKHGTMLKRLYEKEGGDISTNITNEEKQILKNLFDRIEKGQVTSIQKSFD